MLENVKVPVNERLLNLGNRFDNLWRHSRLRQTAARLPPPEPATMRATDDAAPPAGLFVAMPDLDGFEHVVANGLGIHRDTDRQRTAVEDFVEALRCAAEGRVSRKAPIAMRAAR